MYVHCTFNESGSQLVGPILMNYDVVIDVVKDMGDTCERAQRGVGEMGPFLEQQQLCGAAITYISDIVFLIDDHAATRVARYSHAGRRMAHLIEITY